MDSVEKLCVHGQCELFYKLISSYQKDAGVTVSERERERDVMGLHPTSTFTLFVVLLRDSNFVKESFSVKTLWDHLIGLIWAIFVVINAPQTFVPDGSNQMTLSPTLVKIVL